ncbi:hypothetical protein J27TS8_44010 [Robertmurraya siralis]|uniref:Uncharacterized protein n=1 Tax=Robertmurraya siralis TaxID=77777 RepID=A0A919WLP4_9BACI|nr:hypothetical protein [Robertmurraya siralis]GIN64408.1 hypothetical protein J27TS8_44010 [Robertmurraya siralis]
MQKPVENKLNTIVRHSGNSDVDLEVNIDIDTKAIAYGMLCSLYAKGELSEMELNKAIQKLDTLIERDKRKKKLDNNNYQVNIGRKPKLFDLHPKNTRREKL